MKNIKRKEEGVSPVIATILMVAITVVLAATLYMMLPSGDSGDATEAMSGRVRDVSDGYIVEIDSGSVEWDADKPRLYNTDSGVATTADSWTSADPANGTFSLNGGTVYILFNDNDNNDEINGADTFKIVDMGNDLDNYEFRIKGTSLQEDLE